MIQFNNSIIIQHINSKKNQQLSFIQLEQVTDLANSQTDSSYAFNFVKTRSDKQNSVATDELTLGIIVEIEVQLRQRRKSL